MSDEPRPPRDDLHRRSFLRRSLLAAGAAAVGPTLLDGAGVLPDVGGYGRAAAAAIAPPPPRIVTRAQWGADESLRRASPSFATIGKVVVHHTDTANADPDPGARLRSILRYHTESRGWSDIGYNFLIDWNGTVYEGRWARPYGSGEIHDGTDGQGRGVIGAHAAGHNTGSVGIALLGTFSGSSPTAAQLDSLVQLAAYVLVPRGIDPRGHDVLGGKAWPNMAGHRDVVATGCPGAGLYGLLPQLRDRVAARGVQGVTGYRILTDDGGITRHGEVEDLGDLPRLGIHRAPVRGLAATRSGNGFWIVGPDGGVFAFGDAGFHGSMGGQRLNLPMFGIAPTATGRGYWTVASDGGIFSFGDAAFHGSTGGMRLNAPVVGIATTPTGGGYWLVGADGGIFSFGDARFFGSTGSVRLPAPVVAMAPTPSGGGYWVACADGAVHAFGNAPALGRKPAGGAPVRAVRSTVTGQGYWLLDSAGGVHTFGDAHFFGAGVPRGRTALDLVPVVRGG